MKHIAVQLYRNRMMEPVPAVTIPAQEGHECVIEGTATISQLRGLKEEILKLQQEMKGYKETVHILGVLLQQEDDSLKEKVYQMENQLSLTERRKYKENQMKSLEDQLYYLHHMNTELSRALASSLRKKHDILHDIEQLQKLLEEAEKRTKEIEALKPADVQGIAYMHTKLTKVHYSAHVYQV